MNPEEIEAVSFGGEQCSRVDVSDGDRLSNKMSSCDSSSSSSSEDEEGIASPLPTKGRKMSKKEFDSQRAQWDHVHMLYKVDDIKGAARLTKYTDKHIYPNSFDKMKKLKVKYAVQVFSRSVTASLCRLMKAFNFREEYNHFK